MRIIVGQYGTVIIFPYRDYEISISNVNPVSICVFLPNKPHAINGKSFPASAEGFRFAMALIDKLSGPRRICGLCKEPILIDHKYSKATMYHHCCENPTLYKTKKDDFMDRLNKSKHDSVKLEKRFRFKGFGS